MIETAEKQVKAAQKNSDDIRKQLAKETDRIIKAITNGLSTGKPVKKAAGGRVVGPGTGTSDSIDAQLSNGENVWTAAEVLGAGGQDAVDRLRRMAKTGTLVPTTTRFAATTAPLSLEGAAITGRLALEGVGFVELVDGRISLADEARARADARGRQVRF